MKKTADYRRQAEECRAQARKARTPAQRDVLMSMAEAWDGMAQMRATELERRTKMAGMEEEDGKEGE